MATSQNGWPVLSASDRRMRKWQIPGANRHLMLRDGSAGFLLVHNAVWFDEHIERLDLGTWDEWGWANRDVRGMHGVVSNHASGTASDLNATRHPRGVAIHKTFTEAQINAIHRRLKLYRGCLRWGGDYQHSEPDGMHFEIDAALNVVEASAKRLLGTPVGKRVLDANPCARQAILS